MAEIHVERKRGMGAWVWVLLLIVLIVAAVAYLWYAGYIHLPVSLSSLQTRTFALHSLGGMNGA
ncbi:MAG TPA: hypothetical protein VF021_10295 [Longimicrobiales bacterium]